ncbi:MAG: hypothetical protein O2931_16945 [Planctomycetota bacterium]|nr:hypothetical protein [Planctomycetota bacterium]MDA1180470.1 hypothetical protein [Planctomycetota bacterium]
MKICQIFCLVVLMCSPAMAIDLPWWVQRVDVTYGGVGGRGAVTLSGQWRDTCIPDAIGHRQLGGNEVQLEITQPGLNTACGDAITPWSLTEEFGPIDSPRFSIYGSLVSVDPRDRNVRQNLAGPDLLASVAPPSAFNSKD